MAADEVEELERQRREYAVAIDGVKRRGDPLVYFDEVSAKRANKKSGLFTEINGSNLHTFNHTFNQPNILQGRRQQLLAKEPIKKVAVCVGGLAFFATLANSVFGFTAGTFRSIRRLDF